MGLTPERVAAEAAAVADEVGLDRLTLARVADRLGVTLPSLYKHVRGLDGLKRDLPVLGVRELTSALSRAAVGRAGRDALHAIADAYRDYATAHPGVAAASVRAPNPGDAEHLAAGDAVLAILFAWPATASPVATPSTPSARCVPPCRFRDSGGGRWPRPSSIRGRQLQTPDRLAGHGVSCLESRAVTISSRLMYHF